MPALRTDVDPDGLLEYSVVYTDRALNHMSKKFQTIMQELSADLKAVYNADAVAIVSGSGTFAMEAVARQLATDKSVLVIRNGWFSYRWTQILEKGRISDEVTVLTALGDDDNHQPVYQPINIDAAVAAIYEHKPAVVFAPHVETASGIVLPDDYIAKLAQAVHAVGGLLVIDCIASGCVWLDMAALDIDVLITAPQKGWSSTPCAGVVLMRKRAVQAVEDSDSTSFSLDLKQWLNIMRAFENGGHAYHATMPTDGLAQFGATIKACQAVGLDKLKSAQLELGQKVRALLKAKGIKSVAHDDYAAAGVVVAYTERDDIHKGTAFVEQGVQIAAGVPLKVGEPESFKTFRIGLFGLDKLTDVDGTVARFETALNKVLG